MVKHIGIVACSAEGAALCYRTICVEGAAILGLHAHPEVTVHTPSLAGYMACIYGGDWVGVAELMLASAHTLKAVGADFLICPDNTIHQALPQVVRRSPLPWLHIAEEVASEAVARGFKRLAITGTRCLVDSKVYPDALTARGLDYMRPTPEEREEINRIIMDELVCSDEGRWLRRRGARLHRDPADHACMRCAPIPMPRAISRRKRRQRRVSVVHAMTAGRSVSPPSPDRGVTRPASMVRCGLALEEAGFEPSVPDRSTARTRSMGCEALQEQVFEARPGQRRELCAWNDLLDARRVQ